MVLECYYSLKPSPLAYISVFPCQLTNLTMICLVINYVNCYNSNRKIWTSYISPQQTKNHLILSTPIYLGENKLTRRSTKQVNFEWLYYFMLTGTTKMTYEYSLKDTLYVLFCTAKRNWSCHLRGASDRNTG